MATMQQILSKIQKGTAIAADFDELAKLSEEQAEIQRQAEASAKALVETIKQARIEPAVLTNLLASEGLIVLPKIKTTERKTVIFEEAVTTKKGRASSFKMWIGRDVKKLIGDAKVYWLAVKAKGEEYFVDHLNADGRKFYATVEGKQWVQSLFR